VRLRPVSRLLYRLVYKPNLLSKLKQSFWLSWLLWQIKLFWLTWKNIETVKISENLENKKLFFLRVILVLWVERGSDLKVV
jgi:hypothetical protein